MSYNATRLRILELVNTQVPYDKGYLRVNNDIILNTGNEGVINAGYDGHSQLFNSLLYEADYQLNYVESFNNSLAITSYGETVLVSGSDGLNNMYYETNYIKGEDIWDTFNDNNFYISGIAEVELLESVNGISNIYFDYHYIKGIDITDDFINNNLYLNNSGDINIIEGDNISGNLSNAIFMPSDQTQDEIISVDNKYIYFSGVVEGVYVNSDNALGNFKVELAYEKGLDILDDYNLDFSIIGEIDNVLISGVDIVNNFNASIYMPSEIAQVENIAVNNVLVINSSGEGVVINSDEAFNNFNYDYLVNAWQSVDIITSYENNDLYLNGSGDSLLVNSDNGLLELSNSVYMPSDQKQTEDISISNNAYFNNVADINMVISDNGLGNFDTSIIADLFRNVEIYQNITVNANMVNTADGVLVAGNDGRNKISMTVIANITANTGEIRLRWAYLSKSLDPFCVAYPDAMIGTKCTIKDQIMTISGINDGYSGCINIKCVEY